jgi:hypothetical protein
MLAVALDLDFLLSLSILAVVTAVVFMFSDHAEALRVTALFFVCHPIFSFCFTKANLRIVTPD